MAQGLRFGELNHVVVAGLAFGTRRGEIEVVTRTPRDRGRAEIAQSKLAGYPMGFEAVSDGEFVIEGIGFKVSRGGLEHSAEAAFVNVVETE